MLGRAHVFCIFLTMFIMGLPGRHQGHPLQIPHFTLTLRCAVLIFNLIIVILRKEERRCSHGHRRWSGTPTHAPPWRVLDTERWQCCVFFLLLGLGLPCKVLSTDFPDTVCPLETSFSFPLTEMKKIVIIFQKDEILGASRINALKGGSS